MGHKARTFLTSGVALLVAASASAQTVYRIVEPNGRIVFTDQPPASPVVAAKPVAGAVGAGGGLNEAALPFELRQAVQQYPVTLITAADCAPCNAARNWLNNRGIPFTEKTVSTPDDVQALKRLSGGERLPLLNLGSQQLKGFSDAEWAQYADAAGYPKTSLLPPGYKNPLPLPLVEAAAVELANKSASSVDGTAQGKNANRGSGTATPQSPAPNPNNPAGIRF